MKIKDICAQLGAKISVTGDLERDVTEVTAGDLLSYVMGTAPEGAMLITIQTHLNVAAVAVLKDIPFILLAGDRPPTPELAARCEAENISIAVVSDSLYWACARAAQLGLTG